MCACPPKCVCSSAAVECWPCLITLHIHSVTAPKVLCSDHGPWLVDASGAVCSVC